MNESQERRPTQVTIAAGAVIVGALLLFFSGFDSMNNLHTVDFREQVASALSSGGARGFGLTVDQVIGWARIATLVSGGAAAAAAVLGWFALQRHRGARIALTVIAVVLVVCAPFGGGALGAFVAVAIAMLWSGQARDWFAGRPVREREQVAEGSRRSPPEGATAWTSDDSGSTSQVPPAPDPAAPSSPAPTRGFGEVPTSAPVFGQPGPAPQQPSYPRPEQPGPSYPGGQTWQSAPAAVDRRPGGVVAACVLTWVFAGLATVLFLLAAVALLLEPGRFTAQLADQIRTSPQLQDAGVTASMVEPLLWVAFAFYLCWSLAACVLAFFAWRRHNWARILLVVSAFGVVALGVIALLTGSVYAVPHVLACATAAGLLLGGNASRWYARRQPLPGRQRPQQPTGGPPPRAW